MLDFSIITPSYNMLNYLKLCHASIADQKGVSWEHIVVDNISEDGTLDWLERNNNIKKIIEKDNGMYSALNKGMRIAEGNFIGHLNCDEQYLEGILNKVKQTFIENPEVDIIYGDFITINKDGMPNSFKKAIPFRKNYILSSSLYIGTCALFYRKKIFNEGNFFNEEFYSRGDEEFLLRLHEQGYNFLHIKEYCSIFMVTGKNLSQNNNISIQEKKTILENFCKLPTALLNLFKIIRILEKFFIGSYYQKTPLSISFYLLGSNERKKIICEDISPITNYNKL